MRVPTDAVDALVRWYEVEARDLPWRRTDDPYAILVSEFMLQQTRVETVRGRFESFLHRFPDLASLAAADEDEVLAEWSGLGYYRRARALHALARRVIADHDGRLPPDPAALSELPGVGPYTAAAVSSIAYSCPVLAIDGNVARVLCRLLSVAVDPRRPATRRVLERAVAPAFDSVPAGTLNQSLMELGARVCLPRAPGCRSCPCARWCAARREGTEETIPPPRPRRVEPVVEAAAVLERDGRYLLFRGQRPGVLHAMWEFPTPDSRLRERGLPAPDSGIGIEGVPSPDDPWLQEELTAFLVERGWPAGSWSFVGEVRHGITTRRIRCRVYRGNARGPRTAPPDHAPVESGWFRMEEAEDLPLGASARKILRLIHRTRR